MSALGSDPLAYQWYQGSAGDTSTPVGTNSSSYTTPALAAAASYWVRVSNTAGSADSAAAVVSLTPGFATWAAQNGLDDDEASAASDADGDGVSLLLEYALGLDPLAADAGPAALPSLARDSGGSLTFRFRRPTSVAGLAYAVETAASLSAAWSPSSVEPVVESTADDVETLAVTFPAPSSPFFARLRVTQSP